METARQMAREQNDKMAAIISVFPGCMDTQNTFILQFWIFGRIHTKNTRKREYFRAGRDSNSTPNVTAIREREIRLNLLELIHFQ